MKALEVLINGHRVCLAGVGNGVMCATVDWGGDPDREDDLFLHIGGFERASDENVFWNSPSIGVGAEVLVRVIEASAVDPPDRRVRYGKKTSVDEYRESLRDLRGWLTPDERRQLVQELVAELQNQDA